MPLPVSEPKTELCAVEVSEEPFAAVAVPPAWYEPVATSSPVVLPFTPPLLMVKLFTPCGVSIATDISCEWAATVPVPDPPTEPATSELAVAVAGPFCAVTVPSALKEAVPPVLVACPLVKDFAIATRPLEMATV